MDGRLCRGRGLPPGWQRRRDIAVQVGEQHLLGSPIRIGAIRRLIGYVEARDGGLAGWAWHPGDPDVDPVLRIRPAAGRGALRIVATAEDVGVQHARALARPRGFAVAADALAGLRGLLHVTGPDGTELMGSPIDPRADQDAAAAAASALAALRRPRGRADLRLRRRTDIRLRCRAGVWSRRSRRRPFRPKPRRPARRSAKPAGARRWMW